MPLLSPCRTLCFRNVSAYGVRFIFISLFHKLPYSRVRPCDQVHSFPPKNLQRLTWSRSSKLLPLIPASFFLMAQIDVQTDMSVFFFFIHLSSLLSPLHVLFLRPSPSSPTMDKKKEIATAFTQPGGNCYRGTQIICDVIG